MNLELLVQPPENPKNHHPKAVHGQAQDGEGDGGLQCAHPAIVRLAAAFRNSLLMLTISIPKDNARAR